MSGVNTEAEASGSMEEIEEGFNARIGQRLENKMVNDAESTQGQREPRELEA